jgi:hypothetical protein
MRSSACAEIPPRAGHYFVTYIDNSRLMKLHFEHLLCDGQPMFCSDGSSLHQESEAAIGS